MSVGGAVLDWLWLVLTVAVLIAPVLFVVHFPAVSDWVEDVWHRVRRRNRPPDTQSIEALAADLRRLGSHIARVESSNQPAKAFRLEAASRAYDDVLLCACRVLEVPTQARAPLGAVERLETEAVLAQHGLQW